MVNTYYFIKRTIFIAINVIDGSGDVKIYKGAVHWGRLEGFRPGELHLYINNCQLVYFAEQISV